MNNNNGRNSCERFIRIGKIIKPHGIKGEVVVVSETDSPFLFDPGATLLVRSQNTNFGKNFDIEGRRRHGERLLLKFKTINDRDAADELRGKELCAPEELLPEPDEDEFFLFDLIGLQVQLTDGSVLGAVEEVLTPTPEQEIWQIITTDNREVLFPVTDDSVIAVDLEAGTAVVEPPPGLLEIYLEPE